MDYLSESEDKITIVLDGRKVRIGFEGDDYDPFSNKYSS
jgi:hypothetical protein